MTILHKIQSLAIFKKLNDQLHTYFNTVNKKNSRDPSNQNSYRRLFMVRMTLGEVIDRENSARRYSYICYLLPLGSLGYIKHEERKNKKEETSGFSIKTPHLNQIPNSNPPKAYTSYSEYGVQSKP